MTLVIEENRLGNSIKSVNLPNGKTVRAGSTDSLIIKLRRDYYLPYSMIADLLKCSRHNIYQRVKKFSGREIWQYISGKRILPDEAIIDKINEGFSDNEIVDILMTVTLNRVKDLRKGLVDGNSRTPKAIDLSYRRKLLCQSLFGKEYIPDKNFIDWVIPLIEQLHQTRSEVLTAFYINGESRPKKERIYRTIAKNKLKEVIRSSIQDLINREIICLNQDMKSF